MMNVYNLLFHCYCVLIKTTPKEEKWGYKYRIDTCPQQNIFLVVKSEHFHCWHFTSLHINCRFYITHLPCSKGKWKEFRENLESTSLHSWANHLCIQQKQTVSMNKCSWVICNSVSKNFFFYGWNISKVKLPNVTILYVRQLQKVSHPFER